MAQLNSPYFQFFIENYDPHTPNFPQEFVIHTLEYYIGMLEEMLLRTPNVPEDFYLEV